MNTRREFLQKGLLCAGALGLGLPSVFARETSSDLKITKVSHYKPPKYDKATFNQARDIVVIETNDKAITGIGEGGSAEMIKQCAELLIGEDPFRIDRLWQKMYRYYFYPAGREKLHALGALDMALWDIKGKALKVPVYELLGGLSRDFVQCYSTGFPNQGSPKETARACMEAGFYAFRISTSESGETFDSFNHVQKTLKLCEQVREGVGENGNWAIDLHTRFDTHEAILTCNLIEPLLPLFVEDLVRSENPGIYRTLRQKVNVPIAVGEHFGDRWDVNELIENHLIDFSRVTLPNCGGITEFVKISALCETHYVGLVPHFTGPISTAALVHATSAFSGFTVAEIVGSGPQKMEYLNDDYLVFKNGKLHQNERPGIGVELDRKKVTLVQEITKGPAVHHPKFYRPDGSITNW